MDIQKFSQEAIDEFFNWTITPGHPVTRADQVRAGELIDFGLATDDKTRFYFSRRVWEEWGGCKGGEIIPVDELDEKAFQILSFFLFKALQAEQADPRAGRWLVRDEYNPVEARRGLGDHGEPVYTIKNAHEWR